MTEAVLNPRLIVVAGPNGAGKTSITEQLLRHEWMGGCEYVNPDLIAKEEMGGWSGSDAFIKAANQAEKVREQCLREGRSLAFETVLSMSDKIDFIQRAKQAGFFVRLFSLVQIILALTPSASPCVSCKADTMCLLPKSSLVSLDRWQTVQ